LSRSTATSLLEQLAPGQMSSNMATTLIDRSLTTPNIGVYTDPEHNLYIADAKPSLEDVLDGSSLEHGEVTVAIKCSGICG
jgi:L-iditol 2-dehydrogenase